MQLCSIIKKKGRTGGIKTKKSLVKKKPLQKLIYDPQ